MLNLLATAVLIACPVAVDDDEGPSPEEVRAAVAELEEGLEAEELADRTLALQRAALVVHPDVIEVVVDAIRDDEQDVRRAALEALRWMHHEDALDALHGQLKKNKKLKKEPELYALLIKAIGQHANPESVDLVSDDLFSVRDEDVVRARIRSLGRIRSEDSVAALIDIMRSAKRKDVQRYMGDLRVSLMVLTGVDNGLDQDRWTAWWNDNKRDLEVREQPHLLPENEQRMWSYYWGDERPMTRGERREDRGDDPETDG